MTKGQNLYECFKELNKKPRVWYRIFKNPKYPNWDQLTDNCKRNWEKLAIKLEEREKEREKNA